MNRRVGIALLALLVINYSPRVSAHPMGNFSINHYAKLKISRDSVRILYLLDMAEIPTYQEIRQSGLVPKDGDASISGYLEQQGKSLKQELVVTSDDQPIRLRKVSSKVTFLDGAGGLPTMKLAFVFQGDLPRAAGTHKLTYADNNFQGRNGWKEIVVLGDGAGILSSSAPAKDRSDELSTYSTDLLNSPPQQLSASVSFEIPVAVRPRSGQR